MPDMAVSRSVGNVNARQLYVVTILPHEIDVTLARRDSRPSCAVVVDRVTHGSIPKESPVLRADIMSWDALPHSQTVASEHSNTTSDPQKCKTRGESHRSCNTQALVSSGKS